MTAPTADLRVGDRTYRICPIPGLDRLPYSLKVLVENLRRAGAVDDADALARWQPGTPPQELSFRPARILLQDFTGVPCVVDLAAMRDAIIDLGGDPAAVNPLVPAELVIDHSVQVDVSATPLALSRNVELEFERNAERYRFLKWGQDALRRFVVVPPNTGICHQVNLEHLARVVVADGDGTAHPDTLVGTDSHTTMVNGLGVLGWGVGGIEAEAAMLGQPVPMLTPTVVGFRLHGELREGATATDLVLTVTELLRHHGVVGKFVEFFGPGVGAIPVENRATIGNMSPEYGSTCAIFPIDDETLRYLRFTGRPAEHVALVEAYAKEQGLWHEPSVEPVYSEHVELDLGSVVPSISGPSRPQDRIPLDESRRRFEQALGDLLAEGTIGTTGLRRPGVPPQTLPRGVRPASPEDASAESFPASDPPAAMAGVTGTGEPDVAAPGGAEPREPGRGCEVVLADGTDFLLHHGDVVIAAITSCTNTSNPYVMIGAGLLARNAVERGLQRQPWVKPSLAPGSRVVSDYLDRAGLTPYLDQLGFNVVGYGCTTCIGNSGPLAPEIASAITEHSLAVAAVLSGNRNFEGRINPHVRMNYLASPPLVVAYALAGTMDWDPYADPFPGTSVLLADVWPSAQEVNEAVAASVDTEMFRTRYGQVLEGDERWQALESPSGTHFAWEPDSTYVRQPPYFDGIDREPRPPEDVVDARVLVLLGDSITTDHISPAGTIRDGGPAAQWLRANGVAPADFNSYGARRGNHEVMVRGTFANIRLRNLLAPGTEGGVTIHLPSGDELSIHDAAERYRAEGTPLVVIAGKEYGTGSSRDWAAKGTALLGVRAVLAESYERIHRSNLIGMGVLPLELPGPASELGLTGHEALTIGGLAGLTPGATVAVATADGREIATRCRIDTATELAYYRHGGILPFVLRQLAGEGAERR